MLRSCSQSPLLALMCAQFLQMLSCVGNMIMYMTNVKFFLEATLMGDMVRGH
jgi:hypothetical protein